MLEQPGHAGQGSSSSQLASVALHELLRSSMLPMLGLVAQRAEEESAAQLRSTLDAERRREAEAAATLAGVKAAAATAQRQATESIVLELAEREAAAQDVAMQLAQVKAELAIAEAAAGEERRAAAEAVRASREEGVAEAAAAEHRQQLAISSQEVRSNQSPYLAYRTLLIVSNATVPRCTSMSLGNVCATSIWIT